MNSFTYHSTTKMIFGKGKESEVGKETALCGAHKALLMYGGQSAVKSGLLGKVETSLDEQGISYVEFGGIVPNPRLGKVREAIAVGNAEKIDFILAIGGGSVIDSAKAAAAGIANPDMDIWEDIYEPRAPIPACVKIGCIPTIAAAGSETSQFAVLTNEETRIKKGYGNQLIRPQFCILDPELTYSLPPYQTAAGVVDIMMHTMDKYITKSQYNEMSDALSEQLLRVVIRNGRKAMEDPHDYNARSEIMWAGVLSQNDILGLGAAKDSASHQIEHELSGMFDVTHGAGLAAIWGSLAHYIYKDDILKFCQYAVNVWDCKMDYTNPENTALEGIERTLEFFHSIGMPTNLRELGIHDLTDAQIEEMADKCMHFGKRTIGALKVLYKDDVIKIYNMAKGAE